MLLRLFFVFFLYRYDPYNIFHRIRAMVRTSFSLLAPIHNEKRNHLIQFLHFFGVLLDYLLLCVQFCRQLVNLYVLPLQGLFAGTVFGCAYLTEKVKLLFDGIQVSSPPVPPKLINVSCHGNQK